LTTHEHGGVPDTTPPAITLTVAASDLPSVAIVAKIDFSRALPAWFTPHLWEKS
jgi:hypothetical protein